MRFLLLILMSFCAFAVEPDIHLPNGKDLPGWAKELSVKWEAAWGKAAPWRKLDGQSQPGAKMRREAVQDYERSFEKAFDAWAATAILKTIPTKGNDHIEYNGAILELISDKEHSGKHTPVNWLRKDDFYIKYATINHDSLALAFLFTPVNRQHYAATTPQ